MGVEVGMVSRAVVVTGERMGCRERVRREVRAPQLRGASASAPARMWASSLTNVHLTHLRVLDQQLDPAGGRDALEPAPKTTVS